MNHPVMMVTRLSVIPPKRKYHVALCQNLVPLVNIKIAGKWMFIPLINCIYRYWSIAMWLGNSISSSYCGSACTRDFEYEYPESSYTLHHWILWIIVIIVTSLVPVSKWVGPSYKWTKPKPTSPVTSDIFFRLNKWGLIQQVFPHIGNMFTLWWTNIAMENHHS